MVPRTKSKYFGVAKFLLLLNCFLDVTATNHALFKAQLSNIYKICAGNIIEDLMTFLKNWII